MVAACRLSAITLMDVTNFSETKFLLKGIYQAVQVSENGKDHKLLIKIYKRLLGINRERQQ